VNNLFGEVSNRVDRVFKSMIFAAAAGASAIAALFFFSLAAFLLLQVWYGTLWASVIMGGAYALIALVALIAVLVRIGATSVFDQQHVLMNLRTISGVVLRYRSKEKETEDAVHRPDRCAHSSSDWCPPNLGV